MVIKNQILHGFDASNNVVLVDLPHVQVEILVTLLAVAQIAASPP